MFSTSQRAGLTTVAALLLAGGIVLQHKIDPQRHQFEPKTSNVNKAAEQLPIEFALGAATGLREAVAGMLWVRTDEYFDEGNYDAVVPMVRIITWLDPHNTDVYETGAWHMDYNFTDSAQRSDRRYIPFSVALMEEGIANNPTESSLYADLAQTHLVRKAQDYPEAVKWFGKGQELYASNPDAWNISSVGHGYAHALEAEGRIDDAEKEWQFVIDAHQAALKRHPNDYPETMTLDVAEKNLKEMQLRQKWRQTMTSPTVDAGFDATLTRVAPMYLVLSGTLTLPMSQKFVLETGAHQWVPAQGERVEIRLQDYNYKVPPPAALTLTYSLGHGVTVMQDSVQVQNGKFSKRLDLSTDAAGSDPMYPFKAQKYLVTVWTDPASQSDIPVNVGDRIGYLGEGMSDKKYLDLSGHVPGSQGNSKIPGMHQLIKTFVLTRDDLMGNTVQAFH